MLTAVDIKAIPGFPHAPHGWTPADAVASARARGLELRESHWEAIRALQEFFVRHDGQSGIKALELRDALEERFHSRGGMKFLYELFPGGPIYQGCEIAGLQPPAGSSDAGFGSVR
jgi:tRNA 2-thiouridine synthesizing protein E